MRTMNKTSVALRDGTGYLGYPEALHQLHCVVRIPRQILFAAYANSHLRNACINLATKTTTPT